MKGLKILCVIAISCLISSSLQADIYQWTDANGVQHFTNSKPPVDATIIMKTEEVPYDEAADRARMEADRQTLLELTRLEIAEREAELERREAAAERKIAEAERQAEDTLREAEDLVEEARDDHYNYRSYGCYGYYADYCRYPYFGRWYYRSGYGSIYFKKPYYRHRYKHRYDKKHYYGRDKVPYHKKYRDKRNAYNRAHHPKYRLHHQRRHHSGKQHIRSHGRSNHGRRHFGRARSGFRRR